MLNRVSYGRMIIRREMTSEPPRSGRLIAEVVWYTHARVRVRATHNYDEDEDAYDMWTRMHMPLETTLVCGLRIEIVANPKIFSLFPLRVPLRDIRESFAASLTDHEEELTDRFVVEIGLCKMRVNDQFLVCLLLRSTLNKRTSAEASTCRRYRRLVRLELSISVSHDNDNA